MVFVTDVAGLRSTVDADGWRGVGAALRGQPCGHARLLIPTRPSEYRHHLQLAVDDHPQLVIAGSFLLSEAVTESAQANPATRFVLVDPIAPVAGTANLEVLSFREEEAAFLAGAAAGLVSSSGVVAGVYGPGGAADRAHRQGFERGARYVSPRALVLGAYQPVGLGPPYADPGWGADQARAFIHQKADVIFGIGGSTGQGALAAASQAGVACIGGDLLDSGRTPCALGTVTKLIDRAVEQAVRAAATRAWQGGVHSVGLAEGMVAFTLTAAIPPRVVAQIGDLQRRLAAGTLSPTQ